jgi:hypothetical protein
MEATCSSEMSAGFSTDFHGVIYQKTEYTISSLVHILRYVLQQWYSTSFVRVPPDVISLKLFTPPPPKLYVYNSSYTQSIIYT